ncbi:hypothetical protein ABPG75_004638 [Micractinium tetrahymenae]
MAAMAFAGREAIGLLPRLRPGLQAGALRATPTLRRRPLRCIVRPAALAGRMSASSSKEGITLPLNSAELLGLEDVQMPLGPAIEAAYEELLNLPLEEGYSELARLGKEKLLFAARDRLRSVRGRVGLLSPTVQIESLLLPGAMALLHQVRRYDDVITLSEEGAALSTREIRNSSRDTLREIEQDMALATALAQCGLADRALKAGQPALACARLAEALELLTDASGIAGGASSVLPGRTAGGEAAAGRPQLAPRLQADIRAALVEYHPDAVADYLQVPLDRADFELRAREVAALRRWVSAPSTALRADQSPICTAEYMQRCVPRLTASELCALYDWEWLAAGGNPARCPWYFPGLLKRSALAHLVTGFAERRLMLVRVGLRLFSTIRKSDEDVALSLAMCELLLGNPAAALHLLEEDERAQKQAQQKQQVQQRPKKRQGGKAVEAAAAAAASTAAAAAAGNGVYGAGGGRSPPPGPEGRHAVMDFIRQHSPKGDLDPRPGLAQFASWWLATVAYPEFQDTAMGAAPRPDLGTYFEDPRVQAFLAAQDGRPSGGMLGMLSQAQSALLARLSPPPPPPLAATAAAAIDLPAGGASGQPPLQPLGLLPARLTAGRALQWLAGAAALAGGIWWGASVRSSGDGGGWASLWPPAAAQQAQQGIAPEAIEVAKDTGLPVHALRRAQAAAAEQWEQQQQEQARRQQDVQQAAAPQEQQRQEQQQPQQKPVAAISHKAAHKLVQQWLKAKAEAMGPRHRVDQLQKVLAEPMLGAVVAEAAEAARSGWYWQLKPLSFRVDALDPSGFDGAAGGTGCVRALATVEESAQLLAADGQKGDSYQTEYQVEYALVYRGGAWKIASASVLRK